MTMTVFTIFLALSIILFAIGVVGFMIEHATGRMTINTRWSNLTKRQWTYCLLMAQLGALLLGIGLMMSIASINF